VDISSVDLTELHQRCVQENQRFLRGQSDEAIYCFELFRRAFAGQDQAAWEHLYHVYGPLVTRWVLGNQWFANSGEEAQYFVNRALEKMWASISPDKFARFTEVKALLRYLKMCVASAIIDHSRAMEKLKLVAWDENPDDDLPGEESALGEPVFDERKPLEQAFFDQMEAAALWRLIKESLSDPQEYELIYASFVLGLKPREILAERPGQYEGIRHIYRVKETALAKLKRVPEMSVFFAGLPENQVNLPLSKKKG
jgi:hypothetical protein